VLYRLPSLNALRAFESSARHLSFKLAAEELSLTPTAISHQIKQLEDFVGSSLFDRLTRALQLTPTGEAMLPKVREGLECFATAIERSRHKDRTHQLFVVAPPSFTARWLVTRLQGFTSANPEIDLHLVRSATAVDDDVSAGTSSFVAIDMREGDSQVTIRFGNGIYPGFQVDRLFAGDYVAVCSPTMQQGKHPLREPGDIRHHVLLHEGGGSNEPAGPEWSDWLHQAGVTDVDGSRGLHFSDSSLAVGAAINGLGVALASLPLVAAKIAEGRLVAPLNIRVTQPNAYFLLTPLAVAERAEVAAFRTWLLSEAAQMG
jgi:LysR family glycine cleavage system transcriptional activator